MDYQEVNDITLLNGIAVEEFPTNNGPADYALIVMGKVFGAVEGKKGSCCSAECFGTGKTLFKGCLNVGKAQ
jgi:type I restriction enzyme R subunit